MNSTPFDWNTKLHQSFDLLHPSIISSLSNAHTHDILVIIGLITVCLLVLVLIFQFISKVRQIYRTSEPKQSRKKYPSYQNLLDTNNNTCKCFHYSCLPKFQCIKSENCQIFKKCLHYEQINERQINNSISRIYTRHNPSCIHVHLIK